MNFAFARKMVAAAFNPASASSPFSGLKTKTLNCHPERLERTGVPGGDSLLAVILAVVALTCFSAAAQTPTSTPPPTAPAKGQVIYSRSMDENGQTTTQAGKSPSTPPVEMAKEPSAEDAEREAVTFTDFDMDVHLNMPAKHIAARALIAVRNDGKAPLARIPLEISSSLNWERVRLNGKDVAFAVAMLNSDTDHTGQLHEAAIPLPQPLAPGASLQLDVSYSGSIAPAAQRLLAIGTPEDVALHSDWDGIGVDFTGLRGFGNVVWYPVSAAPVILGDGARLFDEIGEHKLRLAGARFRLRLTAEFPHGQAPTVALINGHPAALTVIDPDSTGLEVPGIATADSGSTTLGFEAPSLFLAIRKAHAATNTTIWALPENETAVPAWSAATTVVTPFLQGWLGQRPRAQLTILDLPDGQDSPFETGALLVTSVRQASAEQLDGILAHALTHAWMQSPRAWLSEGVAHFMGTLWVEKQDGRAQALGSLESARQALALAEPASPGESIGQPLAAAISPVYFRTKAAYVLWMLRDVASDATLSAALRAYDPAADAPRQSPGSLHSDNDPVANPKKPAPSLFEKLLEQAGDRRSLSSFFGDWIDNDKGLPDLSIVSAFPTMASAGNWLVAVNVANNGYAAVEVPVTVRSDTASVTQRVLVPARGTAVQRILIQSKPVEVQVNDGTVPESQASIHITRLDGEHEDNSPAGGAPSGTAPADATPQAGPPPSPTESSSQPK